MFRDAPQPRGSAPDSCPILVRAFRRKFLQRCGFFELASCTSLRLIYYRNLVCKILEGVCWGRDVNGSTLSVLKSKELLGCGQNSEEL
jgi:hypothetical protein